MKGLNLSGWEKVGEDKKTTTLKHEKGHMITLAHTKLPKIQQEALKRLKLAGGGEVKGVHTSDYDAPAKEIHNKYEKHNAGESKAGEHARAHQESKGFKKEISREEAINSHHRVLGEMQSMPKPKLNFAEGGDVEQQQPQPPVTVNVSAAPTMPAPAQSAQPVPVQVPNVPKTPNVLLPNGSMSASGVAQTGQASLGLNKDVQQAAAAASVPQIQQSLNQQQNLNQYDTDTINALSKHANDLDQYQQKNPLRENAYLEDMGAGKKIRTALGLILSGGGAGVRGGPNLAYEYLNKQIDRNIQAQKDRFGQQSTVWGAYKDLYGNEKTASDMARVHQLDFLNTQAKMTAAQLGTPAIAANYLDLSSKLGAERNKLILDSAGNLKSTPNMPNKAEAAPQEQESPQARNNVHQPQGVIGEGNATASASVQPKIIEKDPYADTGLLVPGAQEKLDELRYTPKAKDEIDQIKTQYNEAQKADTLLSQLHELHQSLYKSAIAGGGLGYVRRHDPSSTIPFVGDAISKSFIQPLSATPNNKDYDSMKTRITGDIANALRGTNIGQEEIQHMVDRNSPEPGDTPELVEKKERAIRLFIKNSANKSLLKDWNLVK